MEFIQDAISLGVLALGIASTRVLWRDIIVQEVIQQ